MLKMNKKKIELTMTVRDEKSFKIDSCNTIKGDSLIEICAKFPLVIADIARTLQEENARELVDDNIPF